MLDRLLGQNHQVVALARNPSKLDLSSDRLTIVQGSVLDPACVDRVIAGADAVISVLGPSTNQPTFEVSQGMGHILAAMRKHNVRRIVLSAGAGVPDPGDRPGLFDRAIHILLQAKARNVYLDMLKTVDLVRQSGLDWTVIRVPMLTDGPQTGAVKVGMVGKGTGPRLARAALAAFLLKQVSSDQYIRKAPVISG